MIILHSCPRCRGAVNQRYGFSTCVMCGWDRWLGPAPRIPEPDFFQPSFDEVMGQSDLRRRLILQRFIHRRRA